MINRKLLKATTAAALVAIFAASCKNTPNTQINSREVKRPTTQINTISPAAYFLQISGLDEDGQQIKLKISGNDLYGKTNEDVVEASLEKSRVSKLSEDNFQTFANKVGTFRASLAEKYANYTSKLYTTPTAIHNAL